MNGKILAHIGKNSSKASHWLTSLVSSKYSWGCLGGLGGGVGGFVGGGGGGGGVKHQTNFTIFKNLKILKLLT